MDYLILYLIIKNICNNPNIPNNGYKISISLENPKFDTINELIHIKNKTLLYLFLLLVVFFKKLYPVDIADVKIEAIIKKQ